MKVVERASKRLSKHQLEVITTLVRKYYVKRFKRRREPKYGSLNKGFTEQELKLFLLNVPNDKFRLLFKYQAYLGLRIGEVCKLHIRSISFDKRELFVFTEKARKADALLIPQDLFNETVAFIGKHQKDIEGAGGHLFFKDNKSHKKLQHLDSNYIRKVFRESVQKANIDQIYDYSDESQKNKKERGLHRLTSHSLRHYAITHFTKHTNGNVVLASRFARHADIRNTMRYIGRDREELYQSIDYAFSSNRLKEMKALTIRLNK